LSSMAESDPSSSMTGRRTSSSSSEYLPSRPSRDRIRFTLPARVLISPLWHSNRNGWARFHVGMVLVEYRWWKMAKCPSTRGSRRSG
jgi:hypothetical protein